MLLTYAHNRIIINYEHMLLIEFCNYFKGDDIMAAKVNEEKCIGCEACVDVCPISAITMKDFKAVISDDCIECGACVEACLQEAIAL